MVPDFLQFLSLAVHAFLSFSVLLSLHFYLYLFLSISPALGMQTNIKKKQRSSHEKLQDQSRSSQSPLFLGSYANMDVPH